MNPDSEVLDQLSERMEEWAADLSPEEQRTLLLMVAKANGSFDLRVLAETPPEAILEPEEIEIMRQVESQPTPDVQLGTELVVNMKATRLCNLRCTYCHSWEVGPNQQMNFTTLARAIHGVLTAPGVDRVTFVWHGGEPTLRPISFYLKALWLQLRWRGPMQRLNNGMQTNGVGLTDEWVDFCKRFHISLGVSLNGPDELNDRTRVDTAGRGTAAKAREGLDRIREAGLEAGTIMVVDEEIAALGPRALLDYFLELGVSNVGLINVVPDLAEARETRSGEWMPWDQWLRFLRDLFAVWWTEYRDRIDVRELSALVKVLEGRSSGHCYYQSDCFGMAFTIDPDGTLAACDRYAGDSSIHYGSIFDSPVAEVLDNAAITAKREADRIDEAQYESCRWYGVCKSGCPYDRQVNEALGFPTEPGCCGLGPLLDDLSGMMTDSVCPTRSSVDRHHPEGSWVRPAPVEVASAVPVTLKTKV